MKIIKTLSLISVGVILMALIPDREKETLRIKLRELRTEVASFKSTEEKRESFPQGGLTIFSRDAYSITFTGFTGSIVWYQSSNFEDLFAGNQADFHAIGKPIEIQGGNQRIIIPPGANAVLRKSKGDTVYKMEVDTRSTF
jgi:hypothetical protein